MILNPAIEALPLEEKTALQTERLRTIVERAYRKTGFYHQRLSTSQLEPAMLQTVETIAKLPFLTTADLAANYPYGLLTVPVSAIARFQQGVGNKAVGLTQQDITNHLELLARSLVAGQVSSGSVFMMIAAKEVMPYAPALQTAAEGIGATVIEQHGLNVKELLKIILNFGVTALFASPETFLHLAETLTTLGFSTSELPLLSLLCDARQLDTPLRHKLRQAYNTPIYTLYGHADILSMGIAAECPEQNGLHLQEDHFYAEIIDPYTGQPVPDGQTGKLVITTLTREGMPLLRYRTADFACLDRSPCPCGRTLARLHFSCFAGQ